MIRHTVIFTCKPGTPQIDIDTAIENAKKLLPSISSVRSFSMGKDLGLQPGRSGEIAVVADFDSVDGVTEYLNDPGHLEYIKDNLAQIVDNRISVQFEV